MDELEPTLLIIPLVAVLAPLLARALGRWIRVPIVVFELVLGIVVGPAVLGWAHPSEFIDALSQYGLAMLFFVAGSEIEFAVFRGRTGRRAIGGWLISLIVGVGVGWLIAPGEEAVIIGIALCSTALGTILPILRDAAELRTPFGLAAGAIGAVGEFGPLIAISIFLGGREPGISTIVLAGFAAIAGLAIWLAFKVPRGAMHRFVNASLHTSGQFAIRVILLILAGLIALSIVMDLDMLLGAFTAGIVWRLIMRDAAPADREAVDSKVEAVAFGFLVPVFFVYTGVTFDLEALLASRSSSWRCPSCSWSFSSSEDSLPRSPHRRGRRRANACRSHCSVRRRCRSSSRSPRSASTRGSSRSANAALLVGAGMLSVLVFPLVAMTIRGERSTSAAAPLEDDLA